jgi:hypothetical protein
VRKSPKLSVGIIAGNLIDLKRVPQEYKFILLKHMFLHNLLLVLVQIANKMGLQTKCHYRSIILLVTKMTHWSNTCMIQQMLVQFTSHRTLSKGFTPKAGQASTILLLTLPQRLLL